MPSSKCRHKSPPVPEPPRIAVDRRVLFGILLLYLTLAIGYAAVTPFGQAPDESAHFIYVKWIGDGHGLPKFNAAMPGEGYEFHQPPLYYLLAAPFYLATRSGPPGTAEMASRALNIWLNCLFIWLSFQFAQALFPKRAEVRLACAALVAFLPMQVAISTSVTNDILAEVIFAAVLWQAVARWTQGWRDRDSIILGVLAGLGMLTKSTCLVLLPLGWLAAMLCFTREKTLEWRGLLRAVIMMTVVAVVVGGWWLVRNHMLYGDPTAWQAFLHGFRKSWHPQDMAGVAKWFPNKEFSWPRYWWLVATWTYQGAWGVFGNMDLFLPGWVYWALGIIPAGAVVGLARWWWHRYDWLELWQRRAIVLCFVAGLLIAATYMRFNYHFFQAQARYLFVLLPVRSLFTALGFERLVPMRGQKYVIFVPAALALLVSVLALFIWVGPQLAVR